jgi:hypothetical protein
MTQIIGRAGQAAGGGGSVGKNNFPQGLKPDIDLTGFIGPTKNLSVNRSGLSPADQGRSEE